MNTPTHYDAEVLANFLGAGAGRARGRRSLSFEECQQCLSA